MPIYKFHAYVPVFRTQGKPPPGFKASRKLLSMEEYMKIAINLFSKFDVCRRWKMRFTWTRSIPTGADATITDKLVEQRNLVPSYEGYVVIEAEINYKDKTKPVERFFEALRETLVQQLDDQPYVYFYNAPKDQKGDSFGVVLDAGVMISGFVEKLAMVLLQTTTVVLLWPEHFNDSELLSDLRKGLYDKDSVKKDLKEWYMDNVLSKSINPANIVSVQVQEEPLVGNWSGTPEDTRVFVNAEARVPSKEAETILETVKHNLVESVEQSPEWYTGSFKKHISYVEVHPSREIQHSITPLGKSSGTRETSKLNKSAEVFSPYISNRDRANGSPVVVEDSPDTESPKMSLEELRAEVNRLQRQIETMQ